MSPTPRAASALALLALAALVLPPGLAVLGAVALLAAVAVDARAARRTPAVTRTVPEVLSRGVPVPLRLAAAPSAGTAVRLRQPLPPGLALAPQEGDGGLDATLTPRRRGRHALPPVAVRTTGPLGLARWDRAAGAPAELRVFPDLRGARRLTLAVARGRFRVEGSTARGPLGLGTEFELVRDYEPEDDVRHVNWRATARLGRPMTNQYRLEQDRDVVLALDAGRLAAAPLPAPAPGAPVPTVLDACLDAAAAVGLVADELGDRCGAVAFAGTVKAALPPRRDGGAAAIRALFDLEPEPVDADYELAFRRIGAGKRAWVLVLCDLLEEAAARPLAAALPALVRRHAVVVASPQDPVLAAAAGEAGPRGLAAAAMLAARERAGARLRGAGARVLEAPPDRLASACVGAYVRAKARGSL